MGARRPAPRDPELLEVEYEAGFDERRPEAGERTVSTAMVLGAVVVGLLVLWLISGLGATEPSPVAAPEEDAAAPPVLVVPAPVPTPIPTPTTMPTPVPTPDRRFIDSRAVRTARSQLSTVGPSHTVV